MVQVKFHKTLDEFRDQSKYLETVEREVQEQRDEKDRWGWLVGC